VAAPAGIVGIAAENGAWRAAQIGELPLRRELGARQLAAGIVVKADPLQLAVRMPGADQADRAAVAIGFLAHQHGRAGVGRARPLARRAVAVAALVDAVFALKGAVLEVAGDAHEDAVLQLLLAHDRAAFAIATAHRPLLPWV
jgi:hypothetical protein